MHRHLDCDLRNSFLRYYLAVWSPHIGSRPWFVFRLLSRLLLLSRFWLFCTCWWVLYLCSHGHHIRTNSFKLDFAIWSHFNTWHWQTSGNLSFELLIIVWLLLLFVSWTTIYNFDWSLWLLWLLLRWHLRKLLQNYRYVNWLLCNWLNFAVHRLWCPSNMAIRFLHNHDWLLFSSFFNSRVCFDRNWWLRCLLLYLDQWSYKRTWSLDLLPLRSLQP